MNNTGTLQVTTPSDREIVLTRVFDAPRSLVFDAMTKPELVKRWYGCRGWSLVTCEIDLRVGGKWRYVMHGPDGAKMGQFGEYREIARPDRLVSTEAFDEYPGEALATIVLVDHGGKTTFTNTLVYESKQIRDAVIESGMEHGAAETFDQLAEMLASDAYRSATVQQTLT
jgi:uncharacterized protein YndB with AHSA1/START domain